MPQASFINEYGPTETVVGCSVWRLASIAQLTELAGSRSKAAGVAEKEIYDRWANEVPLRRLGKPEEIAASVLFLCTAHAGFITGEILNVNGGAVLVG